jgi:hypothetical protein
MESDTNSPQKNPANTHVTGPTATEAVQIEQNVPPPSAKLPRQKYKIVASLIIIFTLIITALLIYAVGSKNSQPSSPTDQALMRKDKVLVQARKNNDGKGPKLYLVNVDGTEISPLDLKLPEDPNNPQVVSYVVLSPSKNKMLVASQSVSDIKSYTEQLERATKSFFENTEDRSELENVEYQNSLSYSFNIFDLKGNLLSQISTKEIVDQVGEGNAVLFTGWSDDNSLIFLATSNPVTANTSEKVHSVGIYALSDTRAKILAAENAQSIDWPSVSSSGRWLAYTTKTQDTEPENILLDLTTGEQKKLNFTGSFFQQGPDNWVGFQNSQVRNKLIVWSVQSLDSPTTTSPILSENFTYSITSVTWSPDNSIFAVTSRPLQSAYDEENILNIHIYSRSGEEMCKLSVDPGRVPFQESFTDLLFSQDNKKLLAVSTENTNFFKGPNLWQTFDVESCSINSEKKEMPIELNKPIFWFTSS